MVCLAFSVLLCKTGRFSAVLGYTVRWSTTVLPGQSTHGTVWIVSFHVQWIHPLLRHALLQKCFGKHARFPCKVPFTLSVKSDCDPVLIENNGVASFWNDRIVFNQTIIASTSQRCSSVNADSQCKRALIQYVRKVCSKVSAVEPYPENEES